MPKATTMMWLAGGGALAGAALTWLATRAPLAGAATWMADEIGQLTRRERKGAGPTRAAGPQSPPGPSSAFAAYRAEALRRLDEEEAEFRAYLERLRRARDRDEFDGFIRERSGAPAADRG